jgi:hypothetical protein
LCYHTNPALILTRSVVGDGEPQWSGVEWKGAGEEEEEKAQAPFVLWCGTAVWKPQSITSVGQEERLRSIERKESGSAYWSVERLVITVGR